MILLQTAEAILQHHDIPLTLETALREIVRYSSKFILILTSVKYLGAGQGQPWGTMAADAETYEQLTERVIKWWNTMISALYEERGEDNELHALVVSHSATLRCLLHSISFGTHAQISPLVNGKRFKGSIRNTAVITIKIYKPGHGSILTYNDCSHLNEGPTKAPVDIFQGGDDQVLNLTLE